ncbi:MAG: M56 family metallopeptidase [Candidatus Pedobacter colombiensis]|uniref:M56 family metallopeptidase n=1 Tax=Candidatus Pedobacter colombiensis TaxID=3121371 RepID=A0AAJ6B8K7_9SPHI|nr:M56 family metallopeptidase [Pedobacter sp.]WEK20611.1 MAG: M56 family metallopeptidase [Pedobacter sp.]
MNWLYYLLEANLYLAVFYGFYRLFLREETFYTLNRYYLIVAAIIAFVLPLLQLGYLYHLMGIHNNIESNQNLVTTINEQGFTINVLIVYTYLAIAAVFLSKFIMNLYRIMARSNQTEKFRNGNITYIGLQGSETAFSFFNLLFINPNCTDKDTVITHEMIHIHQKHSADILFFEIIQILGWFNPITYLIKKDVKLLHEYIADDATTHTVEKHEYAMFLIQNSFGIAPSQLTNQIFNQSILKMRINMLNKERSGGRARLKFLFALPVIGGMLCASSMAFSKDYAIVDLYPKKYRFVKTLNQDTSKKAKSAAKKKAAQTSNKVHKLAPPPPPPPPPVEPTTKKSGSNASKTTHVKFPPPIVKPDKKVKFPPPIIKDKKQEVPPPPPVEPKS